jgi:hypothetical protein
MAVEVENEVLVVESVVETFDVVETVLVWLTREVDVFVTVEVLTVEVVVP